MWMTLQLGSILGSLLVVSVIIAYATVLLVKRFRAQEARGRSILEWLRHLVEALLGL